MKFIARAFLTLFLVAHAVAPVFAASADKMPGASGAFTEEQKVELRNLVKDYIKENPDIVVQAIQIYQQKQEEDVRAMAETRIKDNMDRITGPELASVGDLKSDVVVTEFYDYNCGYCKHAISDIAKIHDEDKNVRFVFMEMPVLGPTSVTAAQWSRAAHIQGKFFEFHKALMENNDPRNEETLSKIAKQVGMDVDKARLDASSVAVKDEIEKSRQLAMDFQIQGTPGFIVNGKLFRGYLGLDGLKAAIGEARKNKKN